MDQIIEVEKQNSLVEKKVLDRFHPFNPEKLDDVQYQDIHGPSIEILLDTKEPFLPKIPITIKTNETKSPLNDSVVPFNPTAGYQINQEDLKLESRLRKLERPEYKEEIKIDEAKAPLYLRVFSDNYVLDSCGVLEEWARFRHHIKPEFLPYIQRLRVHIFIPSSPSSIEIDDPTFHPASSWEARPDPLSLRIGMLNFTDFYPLETGPLPSDNPEKDPYSANKASEGFRLLLPRDPEKLTQIEIQFILLPEQKGEESTSSSEDTDQ